MPTFDWECPAGHQFWAFTHSREEVPGCAECGAEGSTRIWAITRRNGFSRYPYTTTHITGKPLTITDAGHESAVLREHKLVQRDDASYLTQSYHGWDFAKQEQRYREENGAGLPGAWGGGVPSGMCATCALARHDGECLKNDNVRG